MSEAVAILVVDDEAMVRLAAADLVSEAGFEALGASTADEAIGILERRPDIRLVFTDVDMPGTMDGVKLAHYIRNRWPPIHLIIASGKAIIEESLLPSGTRFFSSRTWTRPSWAPYPSYSPGPNPRLDASPLLLPVTPSRSSSSAW